MNIFVLDKALGCNIYISEDEYELDKNRYVILISKDKLNRESKQDIKADKEEEVLLVDDSSDVTTVTEDRTDTEENKEVKEEKPSKSTKRKRTYKRRKDN